MTDRTVENQNILIRKFGELFIEFLCRKNKGYGGNAMNPNQIVSSAHPSEGIKIRIDDKLNRLLKGETNGEDALLDMAGYRILLGASRLLYGEGLCPMFIEECRKLGLDVYDYVDKPEEALESISDGVRNDLPVPIGDAFCGIVGESGVTSIAALHPDQEPIDLSVQDIEMLASQDISSVRPQLPETFTETSDKETGVAPTQEADPWEALQKPLSNDYNGEAN